MSVGNMVCDEENTPRCKQNELEPHREANCFVQWCLQMIGADEEAVKERLHVPWLVLFWLGPVHWIRVIALVCSHSYACPTPHSSDVLCKQENVMLLRALTAALSFLPAKYRARRSLAEASLKARDRQHDTAFSRWHEFLCNESTRGPTSSRNRSLARIAAGESTS
jgi:hypothetical protein